MRLQVVLLTIPYSKLLRIPIILAFDIDRHGKTLVYSSNDSGILHLHVMRAKKGSEPRQITRGEDPVLMGFLSPEGDSLIYPLDNDGNELHHLYLISLEGGDPRKITEIPYRTFGCDWHPSGMEITRSFASADSCGVETINIETGESFKLMEPTPPILGVEYSHDGEWIACTMFTGIKNQQILIVNREDPSDTIVYSIREDSEEGAPSWSPDDRKLAYLSDASGSNQVVIQEFKGDEMVFLELREGEEVVGYKPLWGPRGDRVYYVVSKHSRTNAHEHPLDGERSPALPFPEGTVGSMRMSEDGEKIFFIHSSMTSPSGIYLHQIGTSSVTPLTPREFGLDLSSLVKPQSVWYESFDGRKIHGWYLPSASQDAQSPAIVYPHGGPTGQVYDGWMQGSSFQSLSQSGFAVLAPNFRGSTGYGAEFRDLNIGDLGGGDLEDVVHGAEWLRRQEEVDGSRISIMGASYGGYMTLMALGKKPDAFAAGVSLVPAVDWLEMYKLSDTSYRVFLARLLGGPPSEMEEVYRRGSPITYVSNVKSPVMIVANRNDSRCPLQPIERYIEKLVEMGHSHEFFVEEKAGHLTDFIKSEKRVQTISRAVSYLSKTLVE